MELLKQLFEIHSPSGKEERMVKFLRYFCNNIPGVKFKRDRWGNVYITKGYSDTYPCLAAHLDQVQRTYPKDFKAVETDDIIFGYSPGEREMCGLGADDKVGIYIALRSLVKYNAIKIALFVQEEVGCIGSGKADITFFDDCRFVIECDRKGYDDFITSISHTRLCSDEFIQDCNIKQYGYEKANGLMTDVQELKQRGLKVSCCNVSCGYYNPHSDEEFIVKKDVLNCLAFVHNIIENCTKVYPHEHQATDEYYHTTSYGYMEQRDELFCIIDDVLLNYPDVTAEELKDFYGYYFDKLTLSDYEEVLQEIRDMNESLEEEKHTA